MRFSYPYFIGICVSQKRFYCAIFWIFTYKGDSHEINSHAQYKIYNSTEKFLAL